jgi:hypothetical protein
LGNTKYLLAIAWLSVLIGASTSNPFQGISASPEREACIAELLQIQGTLNELPAVDVLDTFSNSVICLSQSGSDTAMAEGCISDLAQTRVNPEIPAIEWLNSLSEAIICLSQSEPDATMSEACVSDLVRMQVNPNGEYSDTLFDAIICLARI